MEALQRSIRLLFSILLILAPKSESFADDDTAFKGWTCEELTPNLCQLDVETELVTVKRDTAIRYWKFSPSLLGTKKLPVVVLHGGPAFPHSYLLPLQQLACHGRQVIFYDQAGCGESSVPLNSNQSIREQYPWLLDPAYYALEELPTLLKHLNVDRFHLLGHSWGTMLAQIYALDVTSPERQRLASLSLSGVISDLPLEASLQWEPETGSLGRLPPFVQQRIKLLEANREYESPEYQAINAVLTTFCTCRTAPLPDCYRKAMAGINKEIYVGMQGASEFTIGGVLEKFNVTGRLHELFDVPTLLMSGEYDTVRPAVINVMRENLPLSEQILFERSGHVSAIDEAGPMNEAVSDFLNRVETALDRGVKFVPHLRTMSSWLEKSSENGSAVPMLLTVLYSLVVFVLGTFFGALFGRYSCDRSRGYESIN